MHARHDICLYREKMACQIYIQTCEFDRLLSVSRLSGFNITDIRKLPCEVKRSSDK